MFHFSGMSHLLECSTLLALFIRPFHLTLFIRLFHLLECSVYWNVPFIGMFHSSYSFKLIGVLRLSKVHLWECSIYWNVTLFLLLIWEECSILLLERSVRLCATTPTSFLLYVTTNSAIDIGDRPKILHRHGRHRYNGRTSHSGHSPARTTTRHTALSRTTVRCAYKAAELFFVHRCCRNTLKDGECLSSGMLERWKDRLSTPNVSHPSAHHGQVALGCSASWCSPGARFRSSSSRTRAVLVDLLDLTQLLVRLRPRTGSPASWRTPGARSRSFFSGSHVPPRPTRPSSRTPTPGCPAYGRTTGAPF